MPKYLKLSNMKRVKLCHHSNKFGLFVLMFFVPIFNILVMFGFFLG